MSDKKKQTLHQKKKELEAELDDIQHELDGSFEKVKSDLSSKLDPVEYVRRHPLPMVAISLVTGFLAGKEGMRSHHSSKSESEEEKITSTIWYEMKRFATKKALSLAGDYLDDLFASD